MGWRFSTGFKGLRFTTSSRGSFVTIGGRGVSYRQRIGGGSRNVAPPQHSWSQDPQQYANLGAIPTADAAQLVDQRSEQLLSAINETVSRFSALSILLPLGILAVCVSLLGGVVVFGLAAVATTAFLLYVADVDRKARTYSLFFELDGPAEDKWRQLNSIVSGFATAQAYWRVAANTHTSDWKRNAGAETLLDRRTARVRQANPPLISTNIQTWCVDAGDQQLYFLPDRLLIFQGGRYGAVEYDSLTIGFQPDQFVESGFVPGDSMVIGRTYLYVNKNGGPDRRFNNNREIPIVQYGRTIFSSTSGLNIHLQVSSIGVAEAFSRSWSGRTRPTSSRSQQSKPGPTPSGGPQGQVKSTPRCYQILGLVLGCTRDEASYAYRSLAKKYHPDLMSGLPADLKLIAEERMKEINIAYSEIRTMNGW